MVFVIWVPKLLLPPMKIGIFGPLKAKLAQNWFFWPNISNFGPLGPMPDPKTVPRSCLGGFFVTWVPKLLLPLVRIKIFGPKRQNIVQNMYFWPFFGQIMAFLAHFVPCPTKRQWKQGARCFFRYVGTKTFGIGIFGHFGPGGCGARAVSRHLFTL